MREFAGIDEKSLGRILKIYRKANRLTQQKVADYLGIDRSTYAKYETVRKPEIDVIMKLSVLYQTSLDDFMRDFFGNAEREVHAGSPKNNAPELLTPEERRLIVLFRKSVRKAQILKAVEDIYSEDSEIAEEVEEN